MEKTDLTNKKVLLTGASRGIGLEIANGLCSRGATVLGVARSPRPASLNKNILYKTCDLDDSDDVLSLISILETEFNSIDGLINVAGISLPPSLPPETRFQETIRTNLVSVFNLTTQIIPLLKVGQASIVNISSINSVLGFPDNPGYVASKAGLSGLSRALALDLAKLGIRVNTISPGYFPTNLTQVSFSSPSLNQERANRNLLKRWGRLEELIGPVSFFISSDSSFITGQELFVDGGWTIKGL
jgi:gluconate 5-dehydrogenase